MQLTSTLSFVALAALATAAPVFELLVIRSGSEYQYNPIAASGLDILVGGKDATTFELNDDSTLVDIKTNNNILLQQNNFFETQRKEDGSKGFAIENGYLTFVNGGFYACPIDGKVRLSTSCSDAKGSPVALRIVNQRESV